MLLSTQFKKAIVTGASFGIGRELCYRLQDHVEELIVVARSEEKLQELNLNCKVRSLTLDLTKDRQELISIIQQEAPELVINAAGFGLYGDAITHETRKYLDMVDLNIKALMEISLEAARSLKEKGSPGVILNISSVAAFFLFPSFAVYSATKAFVNSFSEALDFEMEPYNIRVLTACPGMVATEFRKVASMGKDKGEPPSGVMTAAQACDEIIWQINTLKPVHIFNFRNKLYRYLSWILPRRFLAGQLKKSIDERI